MRWVWRAPQSPLHRTSLINNGELREGEGGGSLEVADQSNDATQKRHGYRTIQTSICLCWARTTRSRDSGHTLIQTTYDKNLLHPETARGTYFQNLSQFIVLARRQSQFSTGNRIFLSHFIFYKALRDESNTREYSRKVIFMSKIVKNTTRNTSNKDRENTTNRFVSTGC